jgi:hypothetical protein
MGASRAGVVRPPWVVAGVLALVAAARAVLAFGYLPGARHHREQTAGNSALTSDEQAAITAARIETTNLLSYSRKSFDADWNRALAGAGGQLKSDLVQDKQTTLDQLTKGKFDVTATVTDAAIAGGDGKHGIQVLVVASGHRSNDPASAVPSRIELTMTRIGGRWLATDLQGVELS